MNFIEVLTFWFAVFCYLAGFIILLYNSLFKKEYERFFKFSVLGGFLSHTASGATRWILTGHPPVLSGYENNLAGSWFIMLLGLILRFRFRVAKYFMLFLLPFVLLMLGNGVMHGVEHENLTPSFRSPWLAVHVIFAWLAFGSFTVAGGVAIYYLLLYFKFINQHSGDQLNRLDDINLRLLGFGFISHTIMVSAGAIWAYGLWGSYWSWDPVETWSLISWLAYGVNLHLQLTLKWRGLKGAVITLLCLVTVIITFFGLGLIHQFHIQLL